MVTSKRASKKSTSTKSSSKRRRAPTRKTSATKSGKRKATTKSKARKRAPKKKPKSSNKRKASKQTASAQAMRLTFSYSGNQVKLVSQEPVDMKVLPSDELEGYEEHKGFWAELKNKQNKTVFRRVMHNPTRNDAEVFSDDPEQSISRQPTPGRKGMFVVVVPNTEGGQEVTLSRSVAQLSQPVSGMHGPARLRSLALGPAKEFARFKLRK